MSLLAGFDFLAEVSNETVLKSIKAAPPPFGPSLNPPFDFDGNFQAGPLNVQAHFVVEDMKLDFVEGDAATLTLSFDSGSIDVTAPSAPDTCYDGLAGQVVIAGITFAIQQPQAGAAATVVVLFNQAHVTVAFTDPTHQGIANAAGRALAAQLAAANPTPTGINFALAPNMNGSLMPLQFESAEVHLQTDPDPEKQALYLCGFFFPENNTKGDISQKDGTAISAADDGVAISISPESFTRLLFCPSASRNFETTPDRLPGSCGNAAPLPIIAGDETVSLNFLLDIFRTGQVEILGGFSRQDQCDDVFGFFRAEMTFTVDNGNIQPVVSPPEVDVSVEVSGWCFWVGLLIPILGPLAIAIVSEIATAVVSGDIRFNIGGLNAVNLGGALGQQVTFTSVDITTEGLTLQGTVPIVLPQPRGRGLMLEGSMITQGQIPASNGTFNQSVCGQPARTYGYTVFDVQQQGQYQLVGSLTPTVSAAQFSINGSNASVNLVSGSQRITLKNQRVYTPLPPGSGTPWGGGLPIYSDVHLDCVVSGDTVQISNAAGEGNFIAILFARGTTCGGGSIVGGDGLPLLARAILEIQGVVLVPDAQYQLDRSRC